MFLVKSLIFKPLQVTISFLALNLKFSSLTASMHWFASSEAAPFTSLTLAIQTKISTEEELVVSLTFIDPFSV
jgi:hypothetical protein